MKKFFAVSGMIAIAVIAGAFGLLGRVQLYRHSTAVSGPTSVAGVTMELPRGWRQLTDPSERQDGSLEFGLFVDATDRNRPDHALLLGRGPHETPAAGTDPGGHFFLVGSRSGRQMAEVLEREFSGLIGPLQKRECVQKPLFGRSPVHCRFDNGKLGDTLCALDSYVYEAPEGTVVAGFLRSNGEQKPKRRLSRRLLKTLEY